MFIAARNVAFALATLVVLAGGAARADEAPAPTTGKISAQAVGLRNANGVVRCTLFAGPVGFPGDASKATKLAIATITSGQAVCEFPNVGPGSYAIGMLHDENNNGKMDTNFVGIPTEGYGASNDARGSMGPPSFNSARFAFKGDAPVTLQLKTTY